MSLKKGFGPHLMLDLNSCDFNLLNSLDSCFTLLNNLPDQIGMTKITQPYVFPYEGLVPEDAGITGMVIIAESHISVHTFPFKKYAFIDVFSCKPFDTNYAAKFCVDLFKSKDPKISVNYRGETFPSKSVINADLICQKALS